MISATLNTSVDPVFIADQLRELPPTARALVTLILVILALIIAYVFFVA